MPSFKSQKVRSKHGGRINPENSAFNKIGYGKKEGKDVTTQEKVIFEAPRPAVPESLKQTDERIRRVFAERRKAKKKMEQLQQRGKEGRELASALGGPEGEKATQQLDAIDQQSNTEQQRLNAEMERAAEAARASWQEAKAHATEALDTIHAAVQKAKKPWSENRRAKEKKKIFQPLQRARTELAQVLESVEGVAHQKELGAAVQELNAFEARIDAVLRGEQAPTATSETPTATESSGEQPSADQETGEQAADIFTELEEVWKEKKAALEANIAAFQGEIASQKDPAEVERMLDRLQNERKRVMDDQRYAIFKHPGADAFGEYSQYIEKIDYEWRRQIIGVYVGWVEQKTNEALAAVGESGELSEDQRYDIQDLIPLLHTAEDEANQNGVGEMRRKARELRVRVVKRYLAHLSANIDTALQHLQEKKQNGQSIDEIEERIEQSVQRAIAQAKNVNAVDEKTGFEQQLQQLKQLVASKPEQSVGPKTQPQEQEQEQPKPADTKTPEDKEIFKHNELGIRKEKLLDQWDVLVNEYNSFIFSGKDTPTPFNLHERMRDLFSQFQKLLDDANAIGDELIVRDVQNFLEREKGLRIENAVELAMVDLTREWEELYQQELHGKTPADLTAAQQAQFDQWLEKASRVKEQAAGTRSTWSIEELLAKCAENKENFEKINELITGRNLPEIDDAHIETLTDEEQKEQREQAVRELKELAQKLVEMKPFSQEYSDAREQFDQKAAEALIERHISSVLEAHKMLVDARLEVQKKKGVHIGAIVESALHTVHGSIWTPLGELSVYNALNRGSEAQTSGQQKKKGWMRWVGEKMAKAANVRTGMLAAMGIGATAVGITAAAPALAVGSSVMAGYGVYEAVRSRSMRKELHLTNEELDKAHIETLDLPALTELLSRVQDALRIAQGGMRARLGRGTTERYVEAYNVITAEIEKRQMAEEQADAAAVNAVEALQKALRVADTKSAVRTSRIAQNERKAILAGVGTTAAVLLARGLFREAVSAFFGAEDAATPTPEDGGMESGAQTERVVDTPRVRVRAGEFLEDVDPPGDKDPASVPPTEGGDAPYTGRGSFLENAPADAGTPDVVIPPPPTPDDLESIQFGEPQPGDIVVGVENGAADGGFMIDPSEIDATNPAESAYVVHKGEGISHPVKVQLEKFAEKFGYDAATDGNKSRWVTNNLFKIINEAKIDIDGQEFDIWDAENNKQLWVDEPDRWAVLLEKQTDGTFKLHLFDTQAPGGLDAVDSVAEMQDMTIERDGLTPVRPASAGLERPMFAAEADEYVSDVELTPESGIDSAIDGADVTETATPETGAAEAGTRFKWKQWLAENGFQNKEQYVNAIIDKSLFQVERGSADYAQMMEDLPLQADVPAFLESLQNSGKLAVFRGEAGILFNKSGKAIIDVIGEPKVPGFVMERLINEQAYEALSERDKSAVTLLVQKLGILRQGEAMLDASGAGAGKSVHSKTMNNAIASTIKQLMKFGPVLEGDVRPPQMRY